MGALSGTAASLTSVAGMLSAGVGATSDIRVDGPGTVQEEFTEAGWWLSFGAALSLLGVVLLVVAVVAVSGLQDAAFPRWFARVSAGFAMLLVVSLTGLIPQGFLALVFMLWIGVTGLVLWRVLLRTASSPTS